MAQRGRKSAASLAVVSPLAHERHAPAGFKFHQPQCPDHLGKPERLIWDAVFSDFEIGTTTAESVLATGLEAHMRSRECREIISRDGLTITGRDGQVKCHPLLGAERDARQGFLSALKALGLEL